MAVIAAGGVHATKLGLTAQRIADAITCSLDIEPRHDNLPFTAITPGGLSAIGLPDVRIAMTKFVGLFVGFYQSHASLANIYFDVMLGTIAFARPPKAIYRCPTAATRHL
jgi:hypothetical protein